ncbi:MAG: hypothetical protein QOF30_2157 [Acidimicrobiaceae bacterium]|nr:hypothetical protein [Acidimicrobiaceae bacterium]
MNTLLASQFGLITFAQLIACGATMSWIRWALADGRLRRDRKGVYALVGSPATPHQALMSACLAGGSKSAVSHMAAAWLWGSEHVARGAVELTSFDGHTHQLPGVITHRSTLDPAQAITRSHGIPTVAAPLTVVQLARTQNSILVQRVANDLVKRHCTNFRDILAWIDLVGDRRQPALRELCLRAIEVDGHNDSPAARRVCEKLIRAGIEPFEVDFMVMTPDGILLIDIAWPRYKVGVEYNGGRDHDGHLPRSYDRRRGCRLTAMGWRILDVDRGMTYDDIIQWVKDTLAVAQEA